MAETKTYPVAWMVVRDSECDPPEFFATEEAARKNACLGLADTHVMPLFTGAAAPSLPSIVSDDNTYKPLTDAELLDIWMGTTSTEEPPFKVSKLTRRLVAELRAWRKMALSSDKVSKEETR